MDSVTRAFAYAGRLGDATGIVSSIVGHAPSAPHERRNVLVGLHPRRAGGVDESCEGTPRNVGDSRIVTENAMSDDDEHDHAPMDADTQAQASMLADSRGALLGTRSKPVVSVSMREIAVSFDACPHAHNLSTVLAEIGVIGVTRIARVRMDMAVHVEIVDFAESGGATSTTTVSGAWLATHYGTLARAARAAAAEGARAVSTTSLCTNARSWAWLATRGAQIAFDVRRVLQARGVNARHALVPCACAWPAGALSDAAIDTIAASPNDGIATRRVYDNLHMAGSLHDHASDMHASMTAFATGAAVLSDIRAVWPDISMHADREVRIEAPAVGGDIDTNDAEVEHASIVLPACMLACSWVPWTVALPAIFDTSASLPGSSIVCRVTTWVYEYLQNVDPLADWRLLENAPAALPRALMDVYADLNASPIRYERAIADSTAFDADPLLAFTLLALSTTLLLALTPGCNPGNGVALAQLMRYIAVSGAHERVRSMVHRAERRAFEVGAHVFFGVEDQLSESEMRAAILACALARIIVAGARCSTSEALGTALFPVRTGAADASGLALLADVPTGGWSFGAAICCTVGAAVEMSALIERFFPSLAPAITARTAREAYTCVTVASHAVVGLMRVLDISGLAMSVVSLAYQAQHDCVHLLIHTSSWMHAQGAMAIMAGVGDVAVFGGTNRLSQILSKSLGEFSTATAPPVAVHTDILRRALATRVIQIVTRGLVSMYEVASLCCILRQAATADMQPIVLLCQTFVRLMMIRARHHVSADALCSLDVIKACTFVCLEPSMPVAIPKLVAEGVLDMLTRTAGSTPDAEIARGIGAGMSIVAGTHGPAVPTLTASGTDAGALLIGALHAIATRGSIGICTDAVELATLINTAHGHAATARAERLAVHPERCVARTAKNQAEESIALFLEDVPRADAEYRAQTRVFVETMDALAQHLCMPPSACTDAKSETWMARTRRRGMFILPSQLNAPCESNAVARTVGTGDGPLTAALYIRETLTSKQHARWLAAREHAMPMVTHSNVFDRWRSEHTKTIVLEELIERQEARALTLLL